MYLYNIIVRTDCKYFSVVFLMVTQNVSQRNKKNINTCTLYLKEAPLTLSYVSRITDSSAALT